MNTIDALIDALIDEIFNKICEKLPEGYTIDIHLENGSMHATVGNFRCSRLDDGPDCEESASACLARLLDSGLKEAERAGDLD